MTDKRKVRTGVVWDIANKLEGSLGDAKDYIDGLVEQYGRDAELEFNYFNKYSNTYTLNLVTIREETDIERDNRLRTEANARQLYIDNVKKQAIALGLIAPM